MVSRRSFLKFSGATMVALLAMRNKSLFVQAALPAAMLPPAGIPKFATPLLIPPVMPTAGTIKQKGGKNIDYYEISMKQITQQILPAGLPPTTVWGYGAVSQPARTAYCCTMPLPSRSKLSGTRPCASNGSTI